MSRTKGKKEKETKEKREKDQKIRHNVLKDILNKIDLSAIGTWVDDFHKVRVW